MGTVVVVRLRVSRWNFSPAQLSSAQLLLYLCLVSVWVWVWIRVVWDGMGDGGVWVLITTVTGSFISCSQ